MRSAFVKRVQCESASGEPEALPVDEVELGELVADVAEDVRNERAKEQQRDDHDDRDEGEKQTVLNEGLSFLVGALETSQKSADEVLDHVAWDLLSRRFAAAA